VTLNANPDPGSVFNGCQVGMLRTGTCEVTMNSDLTVIADFADANTFTRVTMVSPNGERSSFRRKLEPHWGGPPEITSYKLSYSLDNGVTWKTIPLMQEQDLLGLDPPHGKEEYKNLPHQGGRV